MSQTPPLVPSYPGPVPLTIGEILDRIFKSFRTSFGLFLKVSLLPSGILLVIYGIFFGVFFLTGFFPQPGHVPDPQKFLRVFFPVVSVTSLAGMCVFVFFEAASCHVALRVDLGFSVTARDALGFAMARLGRLVWLTILRMLIVWGPAMLCFGLLAAVMVPVTHAAGNSHMAMAFVSVLLITLFYLGWIVYAIFVMLRLALVVPASLAEDLTAVEAVKRSLGLTKNAKGRIFVVLLVVYAASYAAVLVLELAFMVVFAVGMALAMAFHPHFAPPWSYMAIGAGAVSALALFLLFSAATWALYATAFAVLYHDQRHRFEGSISPKPAGEPA